MRKILCLVIISVILFNLVGCNKNNQDKNQEGSKFDIKKAEIIIDSYMRDMVTEDKEAMSKLFTDKLLKERKTIADLALKVVGYQKGEFNQVGDAGIFKVKVSETSISKIEASLDTYTIKVVLENWNYKISEIKSNNEKESFYENYGIRIRNKSTVKSDLLIDSDGIPQYSFSKEDKTQETKIPLPRTSFSNISFDYSGDNLAIGIVKDVAFLGIVRISQDAVQTAGDQSSGGEQNSKDQSQNQGPREKPQGKELLALDVIKGCKFDFMVFSPDEKFLLLQYNNNENRKCLRLYTTDKGELIPFKFEENYNVNNLDIKYTYFDNDNLYYEVIPKADKMDLEKQVKGKWQLDLKEFKAKKL